MNNFIAQWPAPSHIMALTTQRLGGYSQGIYAHNNLALHVDDEPETVLRNRAALREHLSLLHEPIWLNQTHSNRVVVVEEENDRDADAAITRRPQQVLAILTADCLPIVFCDRAGQEIAAVHAGWRGLANGILSKTLSRLQTPRHQLLAWIGPAICGRCYAIDATLRDRFVAQSPAFASSFYQQGAQWYADLFQLATQQLQQHGVEAVYTEHICSYEEKNTCYSYRREGQTGRMVTLIWIKEL